MVGGAIRFKEERSEKEKRFMTTLLPLFLQSPPPSDHGRQIGRHYVYTDLGRFRIPSPDFLMRFALLVISQLTAASCAQCAPANIPDGGATSSRPLGSSLTVSFFSPLPPRQLTISLFFSFLLSRHTHKKGDEKESILLESQAESSSAPRGLSKCMCSKAVILHLADCGGFV